MLGEIIWAICFLFSICVVIGGIVYIHSEHLKFLREKKEWHDNQVLNAELVKRLDDMDELRKKVDTISLKAGLRL